MNTMMTETVGSIDKVARYGWTMKNEPGKLTHIHKDALQIHPAYQREVIRNKVKEITANWSWVGAGVIIVGEREDEYWVIDGQHRVIAAKRRSDIAMLPCLVFKTESVKQEAIGFLDLNTGRKPVSSLGKFKAMIAAGDQAAIAVHKTFTALGITATAHATKEMEIKSVGWALRKAREDVGNFTLVMQVAVDISRGEPLQERLLDGLWYINERLPEGITDKRFNDRLRALGSKRLIDAAVKASAYFVRGGAAVWATGMMDEINKGLRNKFVLRETVSV